MNHTPNPIKTAISTLRAGDSITSLTCGHCANNHIVVLEGDPGGSIFELSLSSIKPGFVRDPRGPYHWKSQHKMFFDRHGRPHDHIDLDSDVVEGAGKDAVLQYRSIPTLADIRHVIDPENLPGTMFDDVTIQKLEVLLGRLAVAKDKHEHIGYMQLLVQLLFGNVELNERQMRSVLMSMNSYAGIISSQQRSMPSILDMMMFDGMAGFMGVEVVEIRADGRQRRQGANHSHDAGHMDHAHG